MVNSSASHSPDALWGISANEGRWCGRFGGVHRPRGVCSVYLWVRGEPLLGNNNSGKCLRKEMSTGAHPSDATAFEAPIAMTTRRLKPTRARRSLRTWTAAMACTTQSAAFANVQCCSLGTTAKHPSFRPACLARTPYQFARGSCTLSTTAQAEIGGATSVSRIRLVPCSCECLRQFVSHRFSSSERGSSTCVALSPAASICHRM